MPNIRMLQAAREMAEKEKLVHQGKVKARRSQETDTRDVADKTNKSETARTIKKAEQDNRSAKNELALAEKKAANAQKQKNIAMVGAVISVALGAVQAGADGARAEKNAKTKEAGQLSKDNKDAKATVVDKTRENKKLGAENESIKKKLADPSTKGEDKSKLEGKLKSNTETIAGNNKIIEDKTKLITSNTEKLGVLKKELQGDGKGFFGKASDSIKSAFSGSKSEPAAQGGNTQTPATANTQGGNTQTPATQGGSAVQAPTTQGGKSESSSKDISASYTDTVEKTKLDPKVDPNSDGRSNEDIKSQSYDLAAKVANGSASEADKNQIAQNEAVLASREQAPVEAKGGTGAEVAKVETKGGTGAEAAKVEAKGGTGAEAAKVEAKGGTGAEAAKVEAKGGTGTEAAKVEGKVGTEGKLTSDDKGIKDTVHDSLVSATNAVGNAGDSVKGGINGFFKKIGESLGAGLGSAIGKGVGTLIGAKASDDKRSTSDIQSETTSLQAKVDSGTATAMETRKLTENKEVLSVRGDTRDSSAIQSENTTLKAKVDSGTATDDDKAKLHGNQNTLDFRDHVTKGEIAPSTQQAATSSNTSGEVTSNGASKERVTTATAPLGGFDRAGLVIKGSSNKEIATATNGRQIAIAQTGMNDSMDKSNSARKNIGAIDKAASGGELSSDDKKRLGAMGLLDKNGSVKTGELANARGSQVASLVSSETEYREFSAMKNFFENNVASGDMFAATTHNSSMQKALQNDRSQRNEGGGNVLASLMNMTSSTGKEQLTANIDALGEADKKLIGGTAAIDKLKSDVASAAGAGGANALKYAALDPSVKKQIEAGNLGFNKETGQVTAATGGVMGIGGSTDKIQEAVAADPSLLEAIGKTDPQAAGRILSDMSQSKDPKVQAAFAKIASDPKSSESIGKYIGAAVDSKTIGTADGKKMLDSLEKANPGSAEKIMDQIASNNPDAANKLFDAGANMSNEAFEKMVGGAKIGNTQKASTFNSALLMLNLAGPSIQMYLQAIDKLREAHEQRDEAIKKRTASQNLINKLRGDLKRLEGDGGSAGGGLQGAQAGTGGAK